jgi:hypothetical protein
VAGRDLVVFGDIAIKLFQERSTGMYLGLSTNPSCTMGRTTPSPPDHLGFAPPWDGRYDT